MNLGPLAGDVKMNEVSLSLIPNRQAFVAARQAAMAIF
jgi:hypothetical protein